MPVGVVVSMGISLVTSPVAELSLHHLEESLFPQAVPLAYSGTSQRAPSLLLPRIQICPEELPR